MACCTGEPYTNEGRQLQARRGHGESGAKCKTKTCGKPTVLCLSVALESGDRFTDRSPPGMARSSLSL
eukprot:2045122-Pyramimonas_sp.AAC.1